MTRRLLTIVAAIALLLAACGDDDDTSADSGDDINQDDSATDTPDDDESDANEDASGDANGDAAVTIRDFSFEPDTLEVGVGTTVTWTNEDGVSHTVTAGTPGEVADTFDESLDAGASAEITLDEAGTHAYFCAIHPNMTAEVVVS